MSDDPLAEAGINPDDEDLPAIARAVATSIERLSIDVRELTRRVRTNRIFIVLLCVALLGIVVLGYLVRTGSVCQTQQHDAFRAVSDQLRDAAAKERTAQRTLFEVLLNPASTPVQRRQAQVDYNAGLVAADLQRADNPFPEGRC